jgi:hypothetical protein
MTPTPEIDHRQHALPPGGEAAARAFYGASLGLLELPKALALRAWWRLVRNQQSAAASGR